MKKIAIVLVTVVLLAGCVQPASQKTRDSRMSCAVALVYQGEAIHNFLDSPGVSFVQTYVRFDDDLPEDVIFGLDQEFLDGIARPFHTKGGDWMSFVGVQRNGTVWVARGSNESLKNQPSKERTWEIFDLGQPLQPNTWYRLRVEADFGTRHFRKFLVEGPGFTKSLDLSELTLDYPNFIPFSDRAMSFYVCAMRGRSLMNPLGQFQGKPIVYFDDVSGGAINADGSETLTFENGFEGLYEVGSQPVTLPVIDLKQYEQGHWYLERDEALFRIQKTSTARSGQAVGIADASID